MNVSGGRLLRSRVVSEFGDVLDAVLDDELTGYVRLEPADAILLDAGERGVLTFEDGVPVAAYHTDGDATGRDALSALAVPGPYRVELYELDGAALRTVHDDESVRVPPGAPAERLANDPALAARTRDVAPDYRDDDPLEGRTDQDSLAAFLDDEDRIESIRQQAREQARARADEWGLTDAVDGLDAADGSDTIDPSDATGETESVD